MKQGVVFLDGELSRLDEARIPITDRGLLFGHAIFETLLSLDGGLVLWDAHFARLRAGALRARLRCPEEDELRKALHRSLGFFAREFGAAAAKRLSVRLLLTGGDSMTLQPRRDDVGALLPSRLLIICRSAASPDEEVFHRGYALKTCTDARSKELVDIKSCSYLWNLMCLDDALLEGFDDALFVNPNGEISESTTASFVWMSKEEKILYSAPQENNVLPGTTLLCLQNALEAVGHSVRWKALRVGEFDKVLACAIVSSVRGLVPVRKIDDFVFDTASSRQQLALWNTALHAEQLRNCEPPL
jgi:branched-subunit amino acid aminotransferase/4-amino-4-deoxychorismate lyase